MMNSSAVKLLASLGLVLVALECAIECNQDLDMEANRIEAKFADILAELPAEERRSSWSGWFIKWFEKSPQLEVLTEKFDSLNSLLESELAQLADQHEATVSKVLELLEANDKRLAQVRDAAEYFVALRDTLINDKFRCSRLAEEVFRINDYCTRHAATDGEPAKRRRIDRILRHYFERHEQQCRQEYVQKYHQIMDSKENVAEYQGLFTDDWIRGLMLNDKLGNSAEFLTAIMFSSSSHQAFVEQRQQLASIIYSSLALVKTGKVMVLGDQLKRDRFIDRYNMYVQKPCNRFVGAVSSQIFVPAQFDLKISSARLKEPIDDKFAMGWGRHELCQSILKMADQFRDQVMAASGLKIQ